MRQRQDLPVLLAMSQWGGLAQYGSAHVSRILPFLDGGSFFEFPLPPHQRDGDFDVIAAEIDTERHDGEVLGMMLPDQSVEFPMMEQEAA